MIYLQKQRTTYKNTAIDYYHVFSYSERTMAHSRKFESKLDPSIIKKRSQELRTLSDIKWQQYNESFTNRVVPVLFEQKKKSHWIGTTEHFLKVHCTSDDNLKNKYKNVKLTTFKNGVFYGKILN